MNRHIKSTSSHLPLSLLSHCSQIDLKRMSDLIGFCMQTRKCFRFNHYISTLQVSSQLLPHHLQNKVKQIFAYNVFFTDTLLTQTICTELRSVLFLSTPVLLVDRQIGINYIPSNLLLHCSRNNLLRYQADMHYVCKPSIVFINHVEAY